MTIIRARNIALTIASIIYFSNMVFDMRQNAQTLQQSGPTQKEWGEVKEGLQLSAKLDKESIMAGEPLLLRISIRNTTDNPLSIIRSVPQLDYDLVVTDANGVSASLTKKGEQLKATSHMFTHQRSIELTPKQEIEDQYDVTNMYNMNSSGTYVITAKCMVPSISGNKGVELVSNTVKVTVTEKK